MKRALLGCFFLGASLFAFGIPGTDLDRVTLEDLLGPLPEIDRTIPSPADVAGIDLGARLCYHHEILAYLDVLADASDRVAAMGEYRRSYGGRKPFADARDEEAVKLVRGAIFSTEVDLSHPVGYGYVSASLPVIRNRNRFLEPSTNAYSTPVQYADDPFLSGYISEENLELASGSAGIVVDQRGQGAVVLAIDNPNFRAFWWGTRKLLVNIIFFGDLLESP